MKEKKLIQNHSPGKTNADISSEITIRHVQQGDGTWLCGQCCVACLLGVSLEEAVKRVGHAHGTTTKHLTKALSIEGHLVRKKKSESIEDLPLLCLLRVRGAKTNHWVLKDCDTVMDPGFPYRVDLSVWKDVVISDRKCRVTSYLDLTEYYKLKE